MQVFLSLMTLLWLSFAPAFGTASSGAELGPALDPTGVELGPSLDPVGNHVEGDEDGELGPALDPAG